MKTLPVHSDDRNCVAFTIVELLTVIAIIAILSAILLPAIIGTGNQAKKRQTELQIRDLTTAIQNFNSSYSQMPISPANQQLAVNNGGIFTYGGLFATTATPGVWPSPVPPNYSTNNSDVIAILMNYTNYPSGIGPTVNANSQKNPQQTVFLSTKMSGWDPTKGGKPLGGIGNDLVYRDPWGNPYVITMDLNNENQCLDALYRQQLVSQANNQTGINGLLNSTDAGGNGNNFAFHGNVMVWSAGPDGKVDPKNGANQTDNKDNILSW